MYESRSPCGSKDCRAAPVDCQGLAGVTKATQSSPGTVALLLVRACRCSSSVISTLLSSSSRKNAAPRSKVQTLLCEESDS